MHVLTISEMIGSFAKNQAKWRGGPLDTQSPSDYAKHHLQRLRQQCS